MDQTLCFPGAVGNLLRPNVEPGSTDRSNGRASPAPLKLDVPYQSVIEPEILYCRTQKNYSSRNLASSTAFDQSAYLM